MIPAELTSTAVPLVLTVAVVARGYVNSTPYVSFATREATGKKNLHSKHAFDPTGLFK